MSASAFVSGSGARAPMMAAAAAAEEDDAAPTDCHVSSTSMVFDESAAELARAGGDTLFMALRVRFPSAGEGVRSSAKGLNAGGLRAEGAHMGSGV